MFYPTEIDRDFSPSLVIFGRHWTACVVPIIVNTVTETPCSKRRPRCARLTHRHAQWRTCHRLHCSHHVVFPNLVFGPVERLWTEHAGRLLCPEREKSGWQLLDDTVSAASASTVCLRRSGDDEQDIADSSISLLSLVAAQWSAWLRPAACTVTHPCWSGPWSSFFDGWPSMRASARHQLGPCTLTAQR